MVVEGMWVQVCLMREREIGGGGWVCDILVMHIFCCCENPKISSNHTITHVISSS